MKLLDTTSLVASSLGLPPISYSSDMTFESELLRSAFDYWDGLRAGRLMPARADVRPQCMRHFLSRVALVEVVRTVDGTRAYKARVVGSYIEEVFGRRTGKVVGEGWPRAIAERTRQKYDLAMESGGPIRARNRIAYEGKTWIDGETLVAPLSEGTVPSHFLTVFDSINQR